MLVLIKVLHTVVWAFMVACIGGIYVFAGRGEFAWALGCIGIVLGEVAVLVVNQMRCPLTPVAARFTVDRRPNFDIYLPPWLARYNQPIFGSLYVARFFTGVRPQPLLYRDSLRSSGYARR
jgi:hypothetical protein